MQLELNIAGISVRLDTGVYPVRINDSARPFLVPQNSPDGSGCHAKNGDEIRFCFADRKEEYAGRFLEQCGEAERRLMPDGDVYMVYPHVSTGSFAVRERDFDADDIALYLDPALKSGGCPDLLNLIHWGGLHSRLLSRDCAVFHASCVEMSGEAILFAGRSGIGKSTQAALWEKAAGAEILNGDRVILKAGPEGWLACGSPFCGSSGISVNKTHPLKAIVLLSQSPVNELYAPSAGTLVRQLAAGMESFHFRTVEIDKTLEMALRLVCETKVISAGVRPDESAVRFLKEVL